MKIMKEEALNLVESLNNESFLDGRCLDHYAPYEFTSIGYDCYISFMGVHLWSYDNDERSWITDTDKEPLREFVIKESKKIVNDLNLRMRQL